MSRRVIGIAALFVLLATGSGVAARALAPSFDAREDARLRAHFARVGTLLARRDVSALSPEQRGARLAQIHELKVYARTGAFPRNRGEAPGRTPIFVDRAGNRCAMAHLIEHAGGAALVARVARTANLAYIRDLASDAELLRWLDRAGLSLAEAALIQPSYNYGNPQPEERPSESLLTASTLLAVGMCGPAIWLSLQHEDRTWEKRKSDIVLGTLGGAAVAAAGVADWADDSHLRGKGYFSLTLGVTSIVLSQMNLWSGPSSSRVTASRPDTIQPGTTHPLRTGLRINPDGDPQLAVRVAF